MSNTMAREPKKRKDEARRRSGRNRADLVRNFARWGARGVDETASFFGFARKQRPQPQQEQQEPDWQEVRVTGPAPKREEPEPPASASGLTFWRATAHREKETDTLFVRPDWDQNRQPFERHEVREDPNQSTPARPELMPWARLWPLLRQLLGSWHMTGEPDLRSPVEHLAQGRPLEALPRLKQWVWAPTCYLLIDFDQRLLPFWDDFIHLVEGLIGLRGRNGLQVLYVQEGPENGCRRWREQRGLIYPLPDFKPGAPVLVLGDLGCYAGDGSIGAAWLRLGARLKRKGLKPLALMPCPSRLWDPRLLSCWTPICWDRNTPRYLKRPTIETRRAGFAATAAHRLLTLLAPSIRFEPDLIRAVRFLLSHEQADVGTEAEAWHHEDCRQNMITCYMEPEQRTVYQQSFEEPATQLGIEPNRKHRACALIEAFHRDLSPAVRFEESLLGDILLGRERTLQSEHFEVRFLHTLGTGSQELPEMRAWFDRFEKRNRTNPKVWKNKALATVWKVLRESGDLLPEGLELRDATWYDSGQDPTRDFVLVQRHKELVITDGEPDDWETGSPLIRLRNRGSSLSLSMNGREKRMIELQQRRSLPLPEGVLESIVLDTDYEEVTLEAFQKQPWMNDIGNDAHGLHANENYWFPPGYLGLTTESGSGAHLEPTEIMHLPGGFWVSPAWLGVMKMRRLEKPAWSDTFGRDEQGPHATFTLDGMRHTVRCLLMGSETQPAANALWVGTARTVSAFLKSLNRAGIPGRVPTERERSWLESFIKIDDPVFVIDHNPNQKQRGIAD